MLNEFLFTKIEEEDIENIWFQQDGTTCNTAEATLDVLHPVLKIALSAAELISFGHLGAAFGLFIYRLLFVPSKISFTSTSQRQLML